MTDHEKENGSKYVQLMKGHPLLFARAKLPMRCTCMCWGIECGDGWYEPLRDLSDQLEAINLNEGRKWGIAIRAEQVKEKYGTLRFVCFTELLPPLFLSFLAAPFTFLSWLFDKRDFKCWRKELPDGTSKMVWTPRFRHALMVFFNNISNRIKWCIGPSMKREVMRNAIDLTAEKLIRQAEHECYNTCEECGRQIGTDWSPRCETQGWINYVCEDCAKKRGGIYAIYGEKSDDTKYFMDGKDITEEHRGQKRKYNEELREYHGKSKEKAGAGSADEAHEDGISENTIQ